MTLDRAGLLGALEALPFERNRFVVVGSAPMLMAGLIDSIADIDIVVDAIAWEQACSLGDRSPSEGRFGDHMLELTVNDAIVEVFDGWLGINAAQMVAEAIETEGYRFAPLERVAESKRLLGRPKDRHHLGLIVDEGIGEPPQAGSH